MYVTERPCQELRALLSSRFFGAKKSSVTLIIMMTSVGKNGSHDLHQIHLNIFSSFPSQLVSHMLGLLGCILSGSNFTLQDFSITHDFSVLSLLLIIKRIESLN